MIWAKVTHQFPGVHCWPAAEGTHDYLKNPHRHLFHVTVWIEQFHDDRDIEYLLFKDWLMSCCEGGQMNNQSCEMIAGSLIDQIRKRWCADRTRLIEVEVTEDGENGALVEA